MSAYAKPQGPHELSVRLTRTLYDLLCTRSNARNSNALIRLPTILWIPGGGGLQVLAWCWEPRGQTNVGAAPVLSLRPLML